MIVRRRAHALGFRFRLHRADLPGTPDLIFPSRRKAVFVHGCWWHQHPGCKKASGSKTQSEFWLANLPETSPAIGGLKPSFESGAGTF